MKDSIRIHAEHPDTEQILEAIYRRMEERGYPADELRQLAKPMPRKRMPGSPAVGLDEALVRTQAFAEVQPWWVIPPQGGLFGGLKALVQKIVRKFTFFYLRHVTNQQNQFNSAAAAALQSLTAQLRELSSALEAQSEESQRLLDENDRLKERLGMLAGRLSPREFDYRAFEERFRGEPSLIADRQRDYAARFEGATAPVLDIGCGRGEFLSLLHERGIPAKGVDLDPANVAHCREQGLTVESGDALEYLASLNDGSLGGVFCAQMIEHLTPGELLRLVRLCRRKLAPGGVMLLETLNPKCLMIYTESFYLDPTHVRPVHPDMLAFLAESEGFTQCDIEYRTPSDPSLLLAPKPGEALSHGEDAINTLLFGAREYALTARCGNAPADGAAQK